MGDWDEEIERTKSGQPVYRYEAGDRKFEFAPGDGSLIEAVERHIAATLGEPQWVFHEMLSDAIHVDVHIVGPQPERNFYTLVTSGMAERPMKQPASVEGCEFAELAICLPSDWPGLGLAPSELPTDRSGPLHDERNYWPIRWLKQLARFPHYYDTWIWNGHTIPNGDPPEPFADNTELCSMVLFRGVKLPAQFFELRVGDRDVNFWLLWPLYREELQLKLDKGADALIDRFEKHGITEVVDLDRRNVAKKRWGFF